MYLASIFLPYKKSLMRGNVPCDFFCWAQTCLNAVPKMAMIVIFVTCTHQPEFLAPNPFIPMGTYISWVCQVMETSVDALLSPHNLKNHKEFRAKESKCIVKSREEGPPFAALAAWIYPLPIHSCLTPSR